MARSTSGDAAQSCTTRPAGPGPPPGTMVRGWRRRDTVTVLRDGKVLVTGLNGAQLYDPASGTWTATGKMITPRHQPHGHAAVRRQGARGGRARRAGTDDSPTDAAEVYDPVTGSWTAIANMHAQHARLGMATLLRDGKVLVVVGDCGSEVYDPATGTWTALAVTTRRHCRSQRRCCRMAPCWWLPWTSAGPRCLYRRGAVRPADRVVDDRLEHAPVRRRAPARSRSCSTARSSWRVAVPVTTTVCVSTGAAELYVPAGVSPAAVASLPEPAPASHPRARPRRRTAAPAGGRSRSAERAELDRHGRKRELRARDDVRGRGGRGGTFRLVGSATPNVVPAGATVKVTFLFPAKGPDDGWITVNPRLGEGADVGSVGADNIGMPGKIRITAECDAVLGWARSRQTPSRASAETRVRRASVASLAEVGPVTDGVRDCVLAYHLGDTPLGHPGARVRVTPGEKGLRRSRWRGGYVSRRPRDEDDHAQARSAEFSVASGLCRPLRVVAPAFIASAQCLDGPRDALREKL